MIAVCGMGPLHYLILKNRKLEPLWMLEVLDEAAEQGLINNLPEKRGRGSGR
jgi:hypothetical protein